MNDSQVELTETQVKLAEMLGQAIAERNADVEQALWKLFDYVCQAPDWLSVRSDPLHRQAPDLHPGSDVLADVIE